MASNSWAGRVASNPVCSRVRDSGFLESLGGFIVQFRLMDLGSEGFEVQIFQIWAWVWPVYEVEVRLFEAVWVGSNFGFGGQTCVQISLMFDLSSFKWFEVRYIWVRSNTILGGNELNFRLIFFLAPHFICPHSLPKKFEKQRHEKSGKPAHVSSVQSIPLILTPIEKVS